jgi:hypothetical protein
MGGAIAALMRLCMTEGWLGRIRYKERGMERDRCACSLKGGERWCHAPVREGRRHRPLEHIHGARVLQDLLTRQEGGMIGLSSVTVKRGKQGTAVALTGEGRLRPTGGCGHEVKPLIGAQTGVLGTRSGR